MHITEYYSANKWNSYHLELEDMMQKQNKISQEKTNTIWSHLCIKSKKKKKKTNKTKLIAKALVITRRVSLIKGKLKEGDQNAQPSSVITTWDCN